MWLQALVMVICACVLVAIAAKHNMVTQQLEEGYNVDAMLTHQALDAASRGSNSRSAVLGLTDLVRAQVILEVLMQRNGQQRMRDALSVDAGELHRDTMRQQLKILEELATEHPDVMPQAMYQQYLQHMQQHLVSRGTEEAAA